MADALQHSMVPHHELLSHEIALSELEPWGIVSNADFLKLPQIAIDDPALVSASLRATPGASPWPVGHVVRITRRSAYAGVSKAYRLVVASSAFDRIESEFRGIEEPDDEFESGETEALLKRHGVSQERPIDPDTYIPSDKELEKIQQATEVFADKEMEDFE